MGETLMERKKLIDTVDINDLLSTGGIFSKIASITGQPFIWLDTSLALILDKDYYLVHSGNKWISRAFNRFIELEDDNIIADALSELANLIISKFELSWNKIYSAINTVYKPLENYDMEQKETPDITHTKNVKSDIKTSNGIYGFNSDDLVPTTKGETTGAKLDNEETNKESGNRTLTRHGNIGVTTSQQMLQSEIDLRSNFNFMNQIMEDVDSILCLLVY